MIKPLNGSKSQWSIPRPRKQESKSIYNLYNHMQQPLEIIGMYICWCKSNPEINAIDILPTGYLLNLLLPKRNKPSESRWKYYDSIKYLILMSNSQEEKLEHKIKQKKTIKRNTLKAHLPFSLTCPLQYLSNMLHAYHCFIRWFLHI